MTDYFPSTNHEINDYILGYGQGIIGEEYGSDWRMQKVSGKHLTPRQSEAYYQGYLRGQAKAHKIRLKLVGSNAQEDA